MIEKYSSTWPIRRDRAESTTNVRLRLYEYNWRLVTAKRGQMYLVLAKNSRYKSEIRISTFVKWRVALHQSKVEGLPVDTVDMSGEYEQHREALATCGSILLGDSCYDEGSLELLLRRQNLVYSINNHLETHGVLLDPLTRALLAASREIITDTSRARTTNPR